jgi:hypothetical protein
LTWVEVEVIVPLGNSMAKQELKYIPVQRKGLKTELAFIMRLFLSTNKTSMGKRIKKVCIELQGLIIIAWPLLNSFLPKSPFILLKSVSAIITSSAKIVFLLTLIIFTYFGDTFTIGFRNAPA